MFPSLKYRCRQAEITCVRPFFAPSVWYKNTVSTISSNVAVFLTNTHFFLVSSPINRLLNRSLQPARVRPLWNAYIVY
jgi:hypothetical protein